MEIHGRIHGNSWKIHGNGIGGFQGFMEIHGNSWKIHGNEFMEIHGNSWNSWKIHGKIHGKFMESSWKVHGKFMEKSWKFMEIHGKFMEFLEFSMLQVLGAERWPTLAGAA